MTSLSETDDDFVERIDALTAYLKKIQLPLTQFERESLGALYRELTSLTTLSDDFDNVETDVSPCPTCGSTDGFHTEDACLET